MSCCKKTKTPCSPCDEGCNPLVTGACVTYSGPETEFLHIPPGLNLNDIILGFDSILNQIQNSIDDNDDQTLSYNSLTGELSITNGNSVFLPFVANNGGAITLSGDGITTNYTFPHNYPIPPTSVVFTANSAAAAGFSYVEIVANNFVVHYDVAPPPGTSNIKLSWHIN